MDKVNRQRPVLLLLLVMGLSALVLAQPRPSEYQVKAAYLYNFGKFVQWPNSPSSSFDLCVFGRDPIAEALEATVVGQTIGGSTVTVRKSISMREVKSCRVVFVSASEAVRVTSILRVIGKMPVLTVSDAPDFLQHGGMIQFVLQNDRVRFEVNLDAAEQAGVPLSSELLKVATRVVSKNVPER